MKKKPKIFIVVLHFRGKELTRQCLESVQKIKAKRFQLEVVVVNNNPQEKLRQLKKKFSDFHFIKTKKNLGYTGGNNIGIDHSLENGADWVLLVNNDTLLAQNILLEFIKLASKNNRIGIIGPKIYFSPGREYHPDRYKPSERGRVFWYAGGQIDWQNVLASHRGVDEVDRGQYDRAQPTDFVSGCGMMVKKDVFELIGLLDDRYYLYLEDNDFCQRAKKAGWQVFYCPQAVMWHVNAGSSEVGGDLHDYFLTRNRLLFGWKYAPIKTKLALTRESVKLLVKGRPWQKKAIVDYYLRNFGRGSWSAVS